MDIEEYINSGILYAYCSNTLPEEERAAVEQVCAQYPQVQEELIKTQKALEKLAESAAKMPGQKVQEGIWMTLDNINKEKKGDLNDLPILNKYSDHNRWKRIVMPFIPAQIPDEPIIQPLRHENGILQVLMIGKTGVPDETHEQEQESFLVLEGECDCRIGDNVYHLGPGGFIEIPMYEHHDVQVTSEYVIAVMQRIAV